MSSCLLQVTVVPAFTVSRSGLNTKLSILTSTPAVCGASGASTKARAAPIAKAIRTIRIGSALQRGVDDSETLVAAFERHAGDAEHRAELVFGYLHRSGRRRGSRRRLRKRGRACGVKGDIAFDLLHHLMDMAVEHG